MFHCNVGGNYVLFLSGSSPSLFVSDANVTKKNILGAGGEHMSRMGGFQKASCP